MKTKTIMPLESNGYNDKSMNRTWSGNLFEGKTLEAVNKLCNRMIDAKK